MDTVLLAVGPRDDRRTEALARAVAEVAQPTGASVVLAHVFDDEEFDRVREQPRESATEDALTPDQIAERHTDVRDLLAEFEGLGMSPTVRGAVGDRGATIASLTSEYEADRVVIGGRKRSATGKAVFGSTAQTVLMEAPCPVTFVRSD